MAEAWRSAHTIATGTATRSTASDSKAGTTVAELASPNTTWSGLSASSDSAPSGSQPEPGSSRCASRMRRVSDAGMHGLSLGGRGFLLLPGRRGGTLLLLGLFLVRLAAIVGDVEARALEQQPGASGGHAARGRPAARTALAGLVLDAVEQLEAVPAFGAAILVGRHGVSLSGGSECGQARSGAAAGARAPLSAQAMVAVSTMSSVVQPRDRSLAWRASPIRIGPYACAPPRRWTSL